MKCSACGVIVSDGHFVLAVCPCCHEPTMRSVLRKRVDIRGKKALEFVHRNRSCATEDGE